MPSQHKHTPIRFRPPGADRSWLLDYSERNELPVNAVLTEALQQFRARMEESDPAGPEEP
jgi:hypothetical protein